MKRLVFAALAAAMSTLPAPSAHASPGESSFTPTSFVMPIYSIMLAHGLTTNVPLYSCTPSAGDAGASDCLVDMADATALASLFSEPAGIPAGTYDSIVVMTCKSDSAFVAKVKGSVELEGQTYYTTSGVPTISTNPADLDYASINYGGCGNTIQISPPLVVAAGDSITVNAFFTLQNLSWVLGNFSPGLGGCASAPGGSFNVCSGLPVLVGYVGTQAPTLESYFVTEDPQDLLAAKAAGQVMILSNDTGPFSGFLRRVYSHDSVTPSVSYDVPLRVITRNPDSEATGDAGTDAGAVATDASSLDAGIVPTYDVRAIGDPFQDLTKYRVRFPRFELRDHDGSLFTANGASQVDYRAVKR
jgi:hypothetical protein